MPANLTPEYRQAEERYRAADTPAKKLVALEEMLAVIPKHKGTEHMQADIKTRIAKLRNYSEKKSAHGKHLEYVVEREGAGQVVLVGPPNSGKSSLLSRLTNALPDIGAYPFTTQKPLPGMMPFEDIKIQVVDIPPISEEFIEPWVAAIARDADGLLMVFDMSDDSVLEEMDETMNILERFRVKPYPWESAAPKDETDLLNLKKALYVAHKIDAPRAQGNLEIVREFHGQSMPFIAVSSLTGEGLEEAKMQVQRMLDIVRVYTKVPGKPADMGQPYTVPRGSTVLDLASIIHKDFAQRLKFAKIWGAGKFDGQMVSRQHVLEDKDVIEFHV